MAQDQAEDFPWDIGVFDAHCHPTDTMASIPEIPKMKTRALTLMSTRSQDQDLVLKTVEELAAYTGPDDKDPTHKIVPCFGWHPWFSYQMYDDTGNNDKTPPTPSEHYKAVLQPSCQDQAFIDTLPTPRSLSTFLAETESRLLSHPHALIGEVGLDRAFRLPVAWTESEKQARKNEGYTEGTREGRSLSPYHVTLSHQKAILKAQLLLAGKHQRAVSIHSVQAHGAVLEVLNELWKGHELPVLSKKQRKRRSSHPDSHKAPPSTEPEESETISSQSQAQRASALPFPPRICLHSYSGPPEPLHQFLHPSNPSRIYFSFSHLINFVPAGSTASLRAESVLRMVPEDLILVESDFHKAGSETDGFMEEVVRKVCEIRGCGVREGCERLGGNWREFVFG